MSEAAVKPDRMAGVVIGIKPGRGFGRIRTPFHRDHIFLEAEIREGEIGRDSAVTFLHQPRPEETTDLALDVRIVRKPTN